MKLYHGTAASLLPKIQKEGLLPRAMSKGKDNWKHTVTSNKDAVYLTNAYAFHFASHASDDKQGLVLEIDRDKLLPWLLAPDEDFMEQCSRGVEPSPERPHFAPTNWDMKKRTRHYRKIARFNPNLADASLEAMGTAAYYGPIPWSTVTRYVLIDWKAIDVSMYMHACDTMVSAINFRILKERHFALTRWFFGDPVKVEDLTGITEDQVKEMGELWQKRQQHAAQVLQKQKGLTIVTAQQLVETGG